MTASQISAPRRRDDAGRGDEDERGHVIGILDREAQRDDAAHGIAEDGAREHPDPLGERVDVPRVGREALDALERLGETVAGQVGDEDAPPPREKRGELREVDRGTAEPVDERDRSAPTGEKVARADTLDFRKVRGEAGKKRCLGHEGNVSCVYGLGRGAEPLSRSADMEGLT